MEGKTTTCTHIVNISSKIFFFFFGGGGGGGGKREKPTELLKTTFTSKFDEDLGLHYC